MTAAHQTEPMSNGVKQGSHNLCATIVNLVGREWRVPVLQADGKSALENAETPAAFVKRWLWERRTEFLRESRGCEMKLNREYEGSGTSESGARNSEDSDIPTSVLREADHILHMPLSLIEFVDEDNPEKIFSAARGDGPGDADAGVFEAGKRYRVVVAFSPELRAIVEAAVEEVGEDQRLNVGKLGEALEELRTQDECLEFFWQEWDDLCQAAAIQRSSSVEGMGRRLIEGLCKKVKTPSFIAASVRSDVWLRWKRPVRGNGVGSTGLVSLDLSWCEVGDEVLIALAGCLEKNSTLTTLGLPGNSIGVAGAEALAKCLEKNSTLTTLNLGENSVGDAGAGALAKCLGKNSSLTTLNLRVNRIGGAGAESLAKCLENNSTLTSLNLEYNSVGDAGAKALAKCLEKNSSLATLNLRVNRIGGAGAESLAECLGKDSTLTALDLGGNHIGDAGAKSLAKCLENNSTLTTLNLEYNSVGDAGAKALAKCLEKNSSLATLKLGGNPIGVAGAEALAKCLSVAKRVTVSEYHLPSFVTSAKWC